MSTLAASRMPKPGLGAIYRAISVAVIAWPFCGQAQSASPEGLEDAMYQYDRGHYAEAFEVIAHVADGGDAEASRLAIDMWRFGPALYGIRFPVRMDQLQHWSGHCGRALGAGKRPSAGRQEPVVVQGPGVN